MVIVKDLSRFGRLSSQISYYLEEYFIEKGVRFIAVNDDIDTLYETPGLEFLQFKLIFNDYYLKDTSKKIRKIVKSKKEAEKMIRLGKKQIPEKIDYSKVENLATEARQKFEKIRPRTIEQATRISGVNPSDIAILMVYLKRYYNE